MKKIVFFFLTLNTVVFAQTTIKGKITDKKDPLAFASVSIPELSRGVNANENGAYALEDIPNGSYTIHFSFIGYRTKKKTVRVENNSSILLDVVLEENQSLDEIVVTGTLKAVSRLETPVPVEVYTATFLKKNPTPNIFEALQNVNGVRPQLNCNICNTGDIHINGLEGPYTMVTIDGMPIVSGLSTVYGLSGIPNSLIERIEIVKGPASSLYGSEAVGGLINIITKSPTTAPLLYVDFFSTSWLENNLDLGAKYNLGKKVHALLGLNYFNYNNPVDNNQDNFTDVTLQERISVFNKLSWNRKSEKEFSIAGRFFYEDRWGGEMQWNKSYRGGNQVYGESIYTKRYELLGKYELPIVENVTSSLSYTNHHQNSVYGTTLFEAKQEIAYGQLTWDIKRTDHDFLAGMAYRYQFYNDNTTATKAPEKNKISSVFVQDEIKLSERNHVLLGSRLDYHSIHGFIFTPRIAYRWKPTKNDIFRINAGTGFRVVNLFTEEHAALTGSREVIIKENLNPEKSYNINFNYLKKGQIGENIQSIVEFSSWYTHFKNQIIPDYDTNANQIIYENLKGYSKTFGITGNVEFLFPFGLKTMTGFTLLNSKNKRDAIVSTPILTEKFSATWGISYTLSKWNATLDYTGNIYGPMRLPLLGDLDPRSEYSPFWSIQNIQFTYKNIKNFEWYLGAKNLLNWTPNKKNQFLIARANDPFDKEVVFDANGNPMATANNPYALTFDPSYVYAPNQGIRLFLGMRYSLN